MATLAQLHTVSIEFTEMREKGSETLFHVEMVLRKAEQSNTSNSETDENDVNRDSMGDILTH